MSTTGRPLIAHLRNDAVLSRNLAEHLVFPKRTNKRLLHIAVEAELHCGNSYCRMHVVGRRHCNRIDITLLALEHFAPVRVSANLGDVAAELLKLRKSLINHL